MSKIEVNTVEPQCGTTLTLGGSGDTVALASGASQTGFGRTGTVNWNTTVKTGDFTAVNGEGYFVNTTSGEIDVALPAGTAGAIVAVKDYANTFDTTSCILVPNGSDKIGGVASSSIITTEGIAVTLVFIDSTKGWLVTDSGLQDEAPLPKYVTATGGTITCSGNYKIHTFTGPGTFTVSCAGNPSGSTTVDYLVIAGGGAGGAHGGDGLTLGGGGGAGGYRESSGTASGSYTISPLGACVSALPVAATGYPVVVGGGGTSSFPGYTSTSSQGSNASFSTITSAGGGGGDGSQVASCKGKGGSGGGGSAATPVGNAGCSGNTPPVSPAQGRDGGDGQAPQRGGGGGGAINEGIPGATTPGRGFGGSGATSSINATPTQRAGGGGGANTDAPPNGGAGGGGTGGGSSAGGSGVAGTVNTGGAVEVVHTVIHHLLLMVVLEDLA